MDEPKIAVVFGGSLGIGEATARLLLETGSRVTIVGRDATRLAAAAARIGEVETAVADARDVDAVSRVFEAMNAVDTVVICVAGSTGIGLFRDLNLDEVRAAFEQKTLAQLLVAQVAARHMRPNGSITFVSAGSARSAIRSAVGPAVVNGAIEAAIPTLALELAPIRVNAVSPGLIDTPLWDFMPTEAREAFYSSNAAKLPVGRIGRPDEVAEVIALLAKCEFITGSIYAVDGGSSVG
ncbi:NAD(P)-dependent dehydrogenase (short-subunit alcohol dehydrogenase family) [Roseiarcus fermentans]|uniref:NAD(P)-dependent dehydrogenase (Short-subunit alcohol dehydrogenase family) n=1 Tax=Roseiarcus fermentans TaxID=1473586 RepID=A0A366FAU0_9HYPH|nr:SDR family oxidoreductase [Roseiarcus fermentans]RBP11216.1 NAD(P)-dependent dehydrogenase (short-subunit alcohol dehydrogenase family) [Roseiarcus fermentans]